MKVSLITVTLNKASVIGRTIESVYNQSHADIEYIIVDGGSHDGTAAIVDDWKLRFGKRLKFIQGKDNGVYDAINKGIKASSGQIVGLIHADDTLTNEHVIAQIDRAMADDDVDLVYGDVHYVGKNCHNRTSRYYSGKDFRKELLKFGFAPPHPSLYCRREVFEKYGLYRTGYHIAGDFEMFVRLFLVKQVKSRYIPVDMVEMAKGGISAKWQNRLFWNTLEKRRALRENNIGSSYLHLLYRYFINIRQYLVFN